MQYDGPHPAITPRTRARARHILDHYYIGPARNADVLEIWGYTPDHCYSSGDEVALHVSTTADTWSLEIGHDGPTYECVRGLITSRASIRIPRRIVPLMAAVGRKAYVSLSQTPGVQVDT